MDGVFMNLSVSQEIVRGVVKIRESSVVTLTQLIGIRRETSVSMHGSVGEKKSCRELIIVVILRVREKD